MEAKATMRESKDISLDLFMGVEKNPKYYEPDDAYRNGAIM